MPIREEVILTRYELYDLVWSKPMRILAGEFGMSDVAFAKWCRKLEIPTPGVGYWQKKEFGKKTVQTKLPDPDRGDTLRLWAYRFLPGEPPPQKPVREIPEYEAHERRPENRIYVPETLANPHKLVARAEKALRNGQVDHRYGWTFPKQRPCLDMQISPGCLDRALRLMDALLKSLETRGISVEVQQKEYEKATTFAILKDERIGFGVFESPCKGLREDFWSKKMVDGMVPSGRLVLRIRSQWGGDQFQLRDQKKATIEERLNDFVIALHCEAIRLKEYRTEQEQRRLDEMERQRREAEERRRQEEEARKFRELESYIVNWRMARDIREFLAELNAKFHPDQIVEMREWIDWASRQAERIDPLVAEEE